MIAQVTFGNAPLGVILVARRLSPLIIGFSVSLAMAQQDPALVNDGRTNGYQGRPSVDTSAAGDEAVIAWESTVNGNPFAGIESRRFIKSASFAELEAVGDVVSLPGNPPTDGVDRVAPRTVLIEDGDRYAVAWATTDLNDETKLDGVVYRFSDAQSPNGITNLVPSADLNTRPRARLSGNPASSNLRLTRIIGNTELQIPPEAPPPTAVETRGLGSDLQPRLPGWFENADTEIGMSRTLPSRGHGEIHYASEIVSVGPSILQATIFQDACGATCSPPDEPRNLAVRLHFNNLSTGDVETFVFEEVSLDPGDPTIEPVNPLGIDLAVTNDQSHLGMVWTSLEVQGQLKAATLPLEGVGSTERVIGNEECSLRQLPRIAASEDDFMVAYEGACGPGENPIRIWAEQFDEDATVLKEEFQVDTVTGRQRNPDIGAYAGSGYIIAWQGAVEPDNESRSTDIFARLIDPSADLYDAVEGGWRNPDTPGEGMLFDYGPSLDALFVAWFTFTEAPVITADPPAEEVGAPGQRWLTALLDVDGNTASGTLQARHGGAFNSPPTPSETNPEVGEITIEFASCDEAHVEYTVDTINESGSFEMEPLEKAVNPDGFDC